MKLAVNQTIGNKTERTEKQGKPLGNRAGRLQGLLFTAAISALSLLVIIQVLIFHPSFRSYLINDTKMEGELLEEEAYFFIPCKMELKLLSPDSCPDLEILVNGEKQETFRESSVLLELKSGDVVELDAGSILVEAVVQVSAVSGNISGFLGKTFTISDGITRVALVKPSHS